MEKNSDFPVIHPAWTMLHPEMTMEHLGFIPMFLDILDPRPAAKQIDENYQHGGGWRPQKHFYLVDKDTRKIQYGKDGEYDPPMEPLAWTMLPNMEEIYFYDYAIVAIFQPDGSFEVCRID